MAAQFVASWVVFSSTELVTYLVTSPESQAGAELLQTPRLEWEHISGRRSWVFTTAIDSSSAFYSPTAGQNNSRDLWNSDMNHLVRDRTLQWDLELSSPVFVRAVLMLQPNMCLCWQIISFLWILRIISKMYAFFISPIHVIWSVLELMSNKNMKGKLWIRNVRFEVFTAVTTKNGVFWDVTPCGSCKNRLFAGT
jgi:hypothetical protein